MIYHWRTHPRHCPSRWRLSRLPAPAPDNVNITSEQRLRLIIYAAHFTWFGKRNVGGKCLMLDEMAATSREKRFVANLSSISCGWLVVNSEQWTVSVVNKLYLCQLWLSSIAFFVSLFSSEFHSIHSCAEFLFWSRQLLVSLWVKTTIKY